MRRLVKKVANFCENWNYVLELLVN